MNNKTTLSASLEDYLEAIFHLISQNGVARVRDIAKRLNVKKASVTGALRLLSEKNFVSYTPYELVTITGTGKRKAKDIIKRHEVFSSFLKKILLVDSDTAEKDACKIEHVVSPIVVNRLVEFMNFIETPKKTGQKCIEEFSFLYKNKNINKKKDK